MALLFHMAKKKKNRQNDTNRVQSSSGNDRAKRVLKLNGHLLLARNEAAAAILRAAMKQIEKNSVPQVKRCHTSMEAFRQFLSFSGMFWKGLFQNLKGRSKDDTKSMSPQQASERRSSVLKDCGASFLHWIGLLLAELWTLLILLLETIGKAIWRFLCFCGFQIRRFFKFLKNRMYWGKLRRSIKYRAWKEDSQKRSMERKAERKEVQAKKREELEFRKAMKAEEEAFQKARKKEEEAIRVAKQRREEASRMTERIESELAALALKRKEEEDKVVVETRRKEEALAALSEANKEEEAERARLEERRRIEEEARIEAEKQEAEALKRLETMQKAENERVRKAQEELKRLEQELAAEEAPKTEKTEETPEIKPEEAVPAEQPVKTAEEAPKPGKTEETPEIKPEEAVPAEQPVKAAEEAPAEKPAEPSVTEVPAEPEKPAEEVKEPAAESEPAEELKHPETEPAKPESEPVSEETPEPERIEKDSAETLDQKLTDAEEAYLESKRKKQRSSVRQKTAVAASAAHTAVRTLPVHMPSISVPENLDAKELITEARDNTNGIIYKVVKQLELPKAAESVQTAVLAGTVKYGVIGLAAAICTLIRTAGSEAKPSTGTCFLLFLIIFVVGTALSAGISYLCGMLLTKKGGGKDNFSVLKQNSIYTPISTLAYVFCFVVLIFNKEKFAAVLIAVVLLSIIGHMMVMYREARVDKKYSALIYLLCILLAMVVIIIVALIFSSQLHVIWNALR